MAFRSRHPRLLLCSLLVLAGMAVAGGAEQWRRERRGEQLAAEAQAHVAQPFARPSHGQPPMAGSFGALVAPLLAPLGKDAQAYRALDEKTTQACSEVREGKRP